MFLLILKTLLQIQFKRNKISAISSFCPLAIATYGYLRSGGEILRKWRPPLWNLFSAVLRTIRMQTKGATRFTTPQQSQEAKAADIV
jgi:hypothetical protein